MIDWLLLLWDLLTAPLEPSASDDSEVLRDV